MASKLGEALLNQHLITQEQLTKALDFQRKSGNSLSASLVELGFIADEDIADVLSRQYGVPTIRLNHFEFDPDIIKLIPQETASRHKIIPLTRRGSVLTIAMTDPTNVFAMDDVKFMTGFNVEPVVASESAIASAIAKNYGQRNDLFQETLKKYLKVLGPTEQSEKEFRASERHLTVTANYFEDLPMEQKQDIVMRLCEDWKDWIQAAGKPDVRMFIPMTSDRIVWGCLMAVCAAAAVALTVRPSLFGIVVVVLGVASFAFLLGAYLNFAKLSRDVSYKWAKLEKLTSGHVETEELKDAP